eukprot:3677528-Pyramimonas_sp.AAC.1
MTGGEGGGRMTTTALRFIPDVLHAACKAIGITNGKRADVESVADAMEEKVDDSSWQPKDS